MQDPLNMNIPLQGVDTDFPLIPEGDYAMQISESGVEPNKEKHGFNWRFVLATTSPITAVDGREVKVGTKLSVWCSLQPKQDAEDQEGFIRMLGQTVDNILGTNKENRPNFNAELVHGVVGKMVIGHVTTDKLNDRLVNKVRVKAPYQA